MHRNEPKRNMEIDSVQWKELIIDGAAELGFDISTDQVAQFTQHAHLLLAWNRKINLTTITDPIQIAIKHYLDSVAPLAMIPREGELLDLGTGGGFPGIPLKIMRPEQVMTLIDGTRKKVNFLKQVFREMGLSKIEALHTRAEAMGTIVRYAGRFTVVVSRAVADLKVVASLAGPMLAEGGKIVVYKGPGETLPDHLQIDAKQGLGKVSAFQVSSTCYTLPNFGDQRRVVLLTAL